MTFMLAVLTAAQELGATPQTGGITGAGAAGPSFSFSQMGVMAWPITLCALMVAALAARAVLRMRSDEREQAALARATIDGSLFWGAYAAVLGILGTVVGVIVAAQSIEQAGRVEATLVWGGLKVALTTTVYGLMIFLVAALLWFGLRHWHRQAALGGV
jgi:biopolymer transport protein ExbB/TolQ